MASPNTPPDIPPAPPSNRNGWERYRTWMLPVGCVGCGCIGIAGGILILSLTGLFSAITGLVKSTGTYQTYQLASERIKTDPQAIAALGEPISPGWMSKSEENIDNDVGRTCLRFSVSGSQNSGSAYVESILENGSWQFYQFIVSVNGQPDAIVLIPAPPSQPPSLCPDFDQPDEETVPSPEATQVFRPIQSGYFPSNLSSNLIRLI